MTPVISAKNFLSVLAVKLKISVDLILCIPSARIHSIAQFQAISTRSCAVFLSYVYCRGD